MGNNHKPQDTRKPHESHKTHESYNYTKNPLQDDVVPDKSKVSDQRKSRTISMSSRTSNTNKPKSRNASRSREASLARTKYKSVKSKIMGNNANQFLKIIEENSEENENISEDSISAHSDHSSD